MPKHQEESSTHIQLINVPAGDLMTGGYGLACHPERQDDFKRAVDQCLSFRRRTR